MSGSTNNSFTPASRPNGPVGFNTPNSDQSRSSARKTSEKISKTLLTPCRSVGLKRKSFGDVKKQLLKNSTVDSSPCNWSAAVNCELIKDDISDCHMEENIIRLTSTDSRVEQGQSAERDENDFSCASGKKCPRTDLVAVNNFNDSCKLLSKPEIVDLEALNALANSIKDKREKYKHIELTKLYERKHNIQTLQELTGKWKQGCRSALCELHQLIQESGHTLTLSQLLAKFQIAHDLIGYNEDSDDFE